MIPSILTFDFDLVLGSFLTFCVLMCYLWGQGLIQTMIWGLIMVVGLLGLWFLFGYDNTGISNPLHPIEIYTGKGCYKEIN